MLIEKERKEKSVVLLFEQATSSSVSFALKGVIRVAT